MMKIAMGNTAVKISSIHWEAQMDNVHAKPIIGASWVFCVPDVICNETSCNNLLCPAYYIFCTSLNSYAQAMEI